MTYLFIFYAGQILATGFALWRGGAPERIVGIMMVLAAIGSTMTSYDHRFFQDVNMMGVAVDLGFLCGLLAVAARADRFWPMYIAALHLLGLGIHGVRAFDPGILPVVYARAPAAVGYPMLALLVAGTIRHSQRLRAGMPERAWSKLEQF